MIKIEWKTLSFIGIDDYSVSNTGEIRNDNTGRILKKEVHKKYHRVGIKGKDYRVHRLVAMAFIPNPDNLPQVNHKDECTTNNCVDNLEWCDTKYNLEYSNLNKSVDCYTKDGQYIRTYWSMKDADRECGAHTHSISRCCNGIQNYAGGFRWAFNGCKLNDLIPKKERPKKEKPVKDPRKLLTDEEKKERKRKYYQENRERILARNAEWKKNNHERCINKKREYNATHKEERQTYRDAHREEIRESWKKYFEKNRDAINERKRKRKAQKKS